MSDMQFVQGHCLLGEEQDESCQNDCWDDLYAETGPPLTAVGI
jgi:hypothetical protein